MAEKPERLNTKELADRWRLKPDTLNQWRWRGEGPPYLKLEGHVLYRLEDVTDFENKNLRKSTSQIKVL